MKAKLNEINEKFENVVVLNNEEVACVTGGTNSSTASGRLAVTTAPVASKAATVSAQ
jgi:hypothetical protein